MNSPIITVTNISKRVHRRVILDDVSFTIAKQELVTLIGPNGAGKSTLVKIILGLDAQYSGSVLIAPKERIHYIPQFNTNDHRSLPLSVHEYISIATTALYNPNQPKQDTVAALEHVGLSADVLLQSLQSLSGGERQRVAIARALLLQPTLLVLDEPLAAVDYSSRQGLYALIRHLQQQHQMTVLLISHDIDSVLPLSDRVLCLNVKLHTDCHPTALSAPDETQAVPVHHHC